MFRLENLTEVAHFIVKSKFLISFSTNKHKLLFFRFSDSVGISTFVFEINGISGIECYIS